MTSSGEWRETKNREASQHRLSIRGLSFRAAEESLGRLSRSGPELLNRGSWQIREEALRQNRQLERSSWQSDKKCPGENPELQKRVSWQIKQKWSGAAEDRLLADLRRGPETFKQLERSSWQNNKDALEKIQSCRRESLGRLNRSGPELLKIGSWQI